MTLTSSPHIYFWRQATGKALSHALWEDKTAWSNFTRKLRLHIYHRWSHYYLSHSLMVRTAFSRFLVAVYQCWNQKNKTHHSAFTTSKILLTNLSIWLQKPLWPEEVSLDTLHDVVFPTELTTTTESLGIRYPRYSKSCVLKWGVPSQSGLWSLSTSWNWSGEYKTYS